MSLFGNKPKFCDETLTCKVCGKPFIYPADQQEFYVSKGITVKPSKCPDCTRKYREAMKQKP